MSADAEGVPHLTQYRGDLLWSGSHARVSLPSLPARYSPELEAQKGEEGAFVSNRDHSCLLHVERHANRICLAANTVQRSVGPLPPPLGVRREHDHVVKVPCIGDEAAPSV